MENNFDAIVVGTGVSGGWAAKELGTKVKNLLDMCPIRIRDGNCESDILDKVLDMFLDMFFGHVFGIFWTFSIFSGYF